MIGLHIMRPTSIVVAGGGSETASVRADGGVDFSTATSLSLNGVFTADYDNYMINARMVGSGGAIVQVRLRASGTDNSTANSYVYQRILANNTSVTGERVTGDLGRVGVVSNTQRDGMTVYIYGPNLAQPTAFRSITVYGVDSARIFDVAGTHNQSTAYDGVTLFPDSNANFTGMITVYGYAQ